MRWPLAAAILSATTTAGAQSARCAPPRVPVSVLWTGGFAGAGPHRPSTRCLTPGEFAAMRHARNGWRCTPATATRIARCTAINVPRAHP